MGDYIPENISHASHFLLSADDILSAPFSLAGGCFFELIPEELLGSGACMHHAPSPLIRIPILPHQVIANPGGNSTRSPEFRSHQIAEPRGCDFPKS